MSIQNPIFQTDLFVYLNVYSNSPEDTEILITPCHIFDSNHSNCLYPDFRKRDVDHGFTLLFKRSTNQVGTFEIFKTSRNTTLQPVLQQSFSFKLSSICGQYIILCHKWVQILVICLGRISKVLSTDSWKVKIFCARILLEYLL